MSSVMKCRTFSCENPDCLDCLHDDHAKYLAELYVFVAIQSGASKCSSFSREVELHENCNCSTVKSNATSKPFWSSSY